VDLSLSTRTEGDRTIVEVGGEIDVYTAPRLREQLVDLVADGKYHLVVDMERVDFLDSTGLGVLVGARRLPAPGVHPGAHPEDLPDHRAHQGLPDPRVGGGSGRGHRVTESPSASADSAQEGPEWPR
jgi:hypothetical protein